MDEVTTTEVGASQAPTTTAATPAQTTSTESAATPTQASAESTVPAQEQYAPNFKFKVYDEEKEFDEFIRPFITSKEHEDKIRDLYTKAHGLEGLKSKHERLRAEHEGVLPIKDKYNNLSESLGALSYYVGKQDFDSFFQTLQIPEEKIYQWVAKKLQEQDMTPEQKADLHARREEQQRLYLLEKQNQEAMSRLETFETQQNRMQLESTLARPEIAATAQAFDSRIGKSGAFMEEVIKRGVTLYHITGRDLSPEEVIQDLMNTLGAVTSQGTASPQAGQQMAGGQTKPPVIPNIQSRAASPVKKTPRSIDDLRKIAATL